MNLRLPASCLHSSALVGTSAWRPELSTRPLPPPVGQDPSLRQQHDVAIARAVAELRVLAELCLPLVRPGGHWVAAKGAAPAAEVAAAGPALGRLGGKLLVVEEVDSGEGGAVCRPRQWAAEWQPMVHASACCAAPQPAQGPTKRRRRLLCSLPPCSVQRAPRAGAPRWWC